MICRSAWLISSNSVKVSRFVSNTSPCSSYSYTSPSSSTNPFPKTSFQFWPRMKTNSVLFVKSRPRMPHQPRPALSAPPLPPTPPVVLKLLLPKSLPTRDALQSLRQRRPLLTVLPRRRRHLCRNWLPLQSRRVLQIHLSRNRQCSFNLFLRSRDPSPARTRDLLLRRMGMERRLSTLRRRRRRA